MSLLQQPWLITSLKGLLGSALLIGSVAAIESKGDFHNESDPNNHSIKRWDYLYHMSSAQIPVDALVLGNSHSYTGISPEFLSGALRANAFVLANPGTNVADCYWNLKELLTIHQPSVVALETYSINGKDHEDMAADMLVNQIKAFNARRDPTLKWASLLPLFPLNDAGLAISETLRNHHYCWEGFPPAPERRKYSLRDRYLGRYIRFTSGLKDSLLQQYEDLGPVVDGKQMHISDESLDYTTKIAALCRDHDIELVLFTLPMYKDHVDHAETWMAQYEDLAATLDLPYLNLQTQDNLASNKDYFENTRNANQHMTFLGSVAASDRLGAFLMPKLEGEIPNREDEDGWRAFHSGNSGLYAYAKASETDEKAKVLARDIKTPDFKVDQIALADVPKREDIQQIWVRLSGLRPDQTSGKSIFKMRLRTQLKGADAPQVAQINVPKYACVQREDMAVFSIMVKAMDVLEISDMSLQMVP